jgi:hypothetical protein
MTVQGQSAVGMRDPARFMAFGVSARKMTGAE